MPKNNKSKKPVPSSNWKKLLPSISPKTTTKKKRKTDTVEISPNYKGFNKRQKLEKLKESLEKKEPKKSKKVDTNELWFADDVNASDLDKVYTTNEEREEKKTNIVKKMDSATGKAAELGKFVAIDCEMVGVGPGGVESALARISLVNFNGAVLMDAYVKPQEKVTDYRTFVSGIEPHHLEEEAITFREAQDKASEIIKNRILVGHAVYNDLQALMLSHPTLLIRDTSRYKPFRQLSKGRTPGLKMLVKEVLGIQIQSGSHSSVEDARFTIELYKKVKADWEKSFGAKSGLMMKKLTEKGDKVSVKKKVTIKEQVEVHSDEEQDSDDDETSESDYSSDEE